MQPGTLHAVVTIKKCLTHGGHFYNWDTMHATLQARVVEKKEGAARTNDDQPAAEAWIFPMMHVLQARFKADNYMALVQSYAPNVQLPRLPSCADVASLIAMCLSPNDFLVQKSSTWRPAVIAASAVALNLRNRLHARAHEDEDEDADEEPGNVVNIRVDRPTARKYSDAIEHLLRLLKENRAEFVLARDLELSLDDPRSEDDD